MTDPMILAQTLLQKNFPKFGKFRRSCSYKEMDNSNYNSGNGTAAEVVVSTQDFVQIIFDDAGEYATSFGDNVTVKITDKVAIVPSLDVTVTPKVKDQIIDPDGVIWVVEGIGTDPGPVHWSLLVRPRRVA